MVRKTFAEKVGCNLNKILYEKKVSQKDLAKAVGVSENAISMLVKGEKVVSAEKLGLVADYLNVTYEKITQ